ncbi:MAG: hypothetical protein KAI79_04595 [Bacteroidales bacterium]|nr:hypothetical protein [Bacteroidales bacterium]
MSEYIKMIKDEIGICDEKLEEIETQLENDALEDYEIKLLREAHTVYNARLTYCEKVVSDVRRKTRKSNLIKTINLKQ